jgi:hypothetical protein
MLQNGPFGLTIFNAADNSGYVSGRLPEQQRPLRQHCGQPGAILSQQWFLGFLNYNAFHLSYLSWSYSHDSLHHNMSCIIHVPQYLNLWGYSDHGEGHIDREYIHRTLCSRLTSLQYMKNPRYHSQILVRHTLAKLS